MYQYWVMSDLKLSEYGGTWNLCLIAALSSSVKISTLRRGSLPYKQEAMNLTATWISFTCIIIWITVKWFSWKPRRQLSSLKVYIFKQCFYFSNIVKLLLNRCQMLLWFRRKCCSFLKRFQTHTATDQLTSATKSGPLLWYKLLTQLLSVNANLTYQIYNILSFN